jgi:hypothetical protein
MGGSHAPGDCEDLIVNASQKLCAFVADIAGCGLPDGWAKRPADVRPGSWVCPFDYQWTADMPCLVETATVEPPTPSAGATTGPTSCPAD